MLKLSSTHQWKVCVLKMIRMFTRGVQAYRYLREEVRVFQGKPILVRIKAKAMPAVSCPPINGYTPVQPDQRGNYYCFPPSSYRQPYSAHTPPQTLYSFSSDVWASAPTVCQQYVEVSYFMFLVHDRTGFLWGIRGH